MIGAVTSHMSWDATCKVCAMSDVLTGLQRVAISIDTLIYSVVVTLLLNVSHGSEFHVRYCLEVLIDQSNVTNWSISD